MSCRPVHWQAQRRGGKAEKRFWELPFRPNRRPESRSGGSPQRPGSAHSLRETPRESLRDSVLQPGVGPRPRGPTPGTRPPTSRTHGNCSNPNPIPMPLCSLCSLWCNPPFQHPRGGDRAPGSPLAKSFITATLKPLDGGPCRDLHALPGSPIRPALRSDGHGVCPFPISSLDTQSKPEQRTREPDVRVSIRIHD
jgi:hypothetical protein